MDFLRITPLDIYQQEFKKVLRGVDPDEVEEFLERVADDYEQVLKENATLRNQLESLESQLTTGARAQRPMGLDARAKERADVMIRDATKEAESIVHQAKIEAEDIIEKARAKAQEISSEIEANRFLDRKADLVGESMRETEQLPEKIKMEELELRREVSRLRGQKERFLVEYRELLEKHLKILTAEYSEKIDN